jgi:hypothetical protein
MDCHRLFTEHGGDQWMNGFGIVNKKKLLIHYPSAGWLPDSRLSLTFACAMQTRYFSKGRG